MDNLGLIIKDSKVVVNSRTVAEKYEKRHDNVIRDIRSIINTIPEAVLNFEETYYLDSQGKKQPAYDMDRQGFSMLVMGFTGEKAKRFTYKYTLAFEQMAKELESKQPLQIDSKFMYQIARQLEEKEKQISLLQPKADMYDVLLTADNCQDMGQVAKSFGIGRNKFFDLLRKHKIIMKKPSTLPYQRFIDEGYFEVIQVNKSYSEFTGNFTKAMVTAKGIDYIGRVLREKEGIFLREVI